jgi:DNA end-binding protein Ku
VPPVREAEVRLAEQLVEQISVNTFEPTKFEDDVKKRVLADIARKIDGHQISTAEDEGTPAQIIDLMEALKASLQQSEQARHPAKRSPSADVTTETAKPRSRKRQSG